MTLLAVTDWYAFFFLLFALAACVFACGRVVHQQHCPDGVLPDAVVGRDGRPVFLAGAEFIGAMQLMIYVGGTLVLLVFGVMLTAQARFISMRIAQR